MQTLLSSAENGPGIKQQRKIHPDDGTYKHRKYSVFSNLHVLPSAHKAFQFRE
jgi:hypothetical protein